MRCNNCGEKATYKGPDPFLEEFPELLEGDNEEVWWCEKCYEDRQGEI